MKLRTSVAIFLLILTGCSKALRPQQLLRDAKELSSDRYQGRKTGTPGNHKAADYIVKRFEEIGLKPFGQHYRNTFEIKNDGRMISGTNLLGYIEGKRQDVIVISAHYDHIGIINNQIYNGADDNASGVAGLLALAKYFKNNPPQNTIIFASFDAEEMGFLGAKAFLANPPVPISRIKLNINLDMIGRADKGEFFAAGTFHYPALKKYIIQDDSKVKLLLGHDNPAFGKNDWTSQSDHFVFHEKHIPFIYFGVEDHPDYHKPTDDFDRINADCFENVVKLIIANAASFDKGLSIQSSFREKLIMND